MALTTPRIHAVHLATSEHITISDSEMSPAMKLESSSPPAPVVTSTDISDNEKSMAEEIPAEQAFPEESRSKSPTIHVSVKYNKLASPCSDHTRSPWNTSPMSNHTNEPKSPIKRTSPPQTSPSSSPEPCRPILSSPNNLKQNNHIHNPVFDNRVSPDGFKISPSLMSESINPFLKIPSTAINPFPTPHSFLPNPFLPAADPKVFLGPANFSLISQHLHNVQQMSLGNLQKDLSLQKEVPGMTLQQLQFLQSHLQNLPLQLQTVPQVPFAKNLLPESKTQLSMLMQARKNNKIEKDDRRKDLISFRPVMSKSQQSPEKSNNVMNALRYQTSDSKSNELKSKYIEDVKGRENNCFADDSDSEELLSVGSESPPPNCHVTPFRRDTDNESDAGSSSLECPSLRHPSVGGNCLNRTLNSNMLDKSKLFNSYKNKLQNNFNSKTDAVNNRTLKFSIDNILKSDFGNGPPDLIPNSKKNSESKKEKSEPKEKSSSVNHKDGKKGDGDKEAPMDLSQDSQGSNTTGDTPMLWPAWVYCTRYSDRPSSGRSPRTRRPKNKEKNPEEKRPRTAFSGDQLSRLKHEFAENRYLTERRRQDLARELGLNEAQIKIWFQNKRAKMKKARGEKNPLALQLMAQGLYNHSTVPLTREEEEAAAAELSD